jgi:phosphoglycolate phosphatase
MRSRKNVRCSQCGSLERTRIIQLLLNKYQVPAKGQKFLHFAPERQFARTFREILGENYWPVDYFPDLFPFEKVKKFDLTTDAEELESESFDLILHSHVIEHIPCNYTAVLYHLHRALKQNGLHIFCIPITPDKHYACDFGQLEPHYALKQYGQEDHVRRFGSLDIQKTLGMVFKLPAEYNLEDVVQPELLDAHNIPPYARRGWTPHSVLVMRKSDLKLTL